MQLVELVVLGLACWRLASLAQFERGPFAVFTRLRGRFGVEHDEDGLPVSWPDGEVGRMARCIRCGSVWVGVGLAGLYLWWPVAATLLALPFALSAVAIALEVIFDGTGEH